MYSPTKSLSVGERLDQIKPGPYLLKWTIFLRLTLFWDFFDLSMAGGLLGLWLNSGVSTLNLNAVFISATAFGMLIGNIGTTVLVDRVGRKSTLRYALAIVAATSLLSATLPFSMIVLIGLRFLCGIGMGSLPVPVLLLLTEMTPPTVRASWSFWSALIDRAGLFGSALAGYLLLQSFNGWRWMYALPGLSCLLLLMIGKFLPESPRWLAGKGRQAEAKAMVAKFERDRGYMTEEQVESPPEPDAPLPEGKFRHREYLITLVAACVMMMGINGGFFLFLQYLPTILLVGGIKLSHGLAYNLVIVSGTLFAGVVGALLGDRIGRRKMMLTGSLAGAFFAATFLLLLNQSLLLGQVAGFCLLAVLGYLGTLVFLYVCEIFPTRVRGTYLGIVTSSSRVCNFFLPLSVVMLTPLGIGHVVTGIMAGLLVAVALAAWIVRVETAAVPLDHHVPH